MPLDDKHNEGQDGTSVGEGLEFEEAVLFEPGFVRAKKEVMLHKSLV